MAATERMVVLMSPRERAALEAKARRAGRISAGELVRRAVAAYDEGTGDETSELRTLLELLAATHAETLRRLETAERKLDETLAVLAGSEPRS